VKPTNNYIIVTWHRQYTRCHTPHATRPHCQAKVLRSYTLGRKVRKKDLSVLYHTKNSGSMNKSLPGAHDHCQNKHCEWVNMHLDQDMQFGDDFETYSLSHRRQRCALRTQVLIARYPTQPIYQQKERKQLLVPQS